MSKLLAITITALVLAVITACGSSRNITAEADETPSPTPADKLVAQCANELINKGMSKKQAISQCLKEEADDIRWEAAVKRQAKHWMSDLYQEAEIQNSMGFWYVDYDEIRFSLGKGQNGRPDPRNIKGCSYGGDSVWSYKNNVRLCRAFMDAGREYRETTGLE